MNLVHYGASAYNPSLFKPIRDAGRNKPRGGLWTSPVNSAYGWRDWCREEGYGDCSLCFHVEFEGNLLVIDCVGDLYKLDWMDRARIPGFYRPRFENLLKKGIDAIHLTERGQQETRMSYPHDLYGWDCESVLILNPASIHDTKRKSPIDPGSS